MTTNLWKAFSGLVDRPPLQVATVLSVSGGIARVQFPGGGELLARGDAKVGEKVFVRDGVIETQAPSLPLFQIEID